LEEKFSKAFRAIPDPLALARLSDGTLLDVNESFVRTFGYAREEAVGRTGIELGIWRSPEDRARMVGALAGGRVHNMEFEFGTRSGHVLIGLLSIEALDVDGELCLLAVIRDITDRKQMEEALIFNEQRYRELFEYASDMVFTSTLEGRLSSLNRAGERLTGYAREEAHGLPLEHFVVPEHRPRIRRGIQRLLGGEGHVVSDFDVQVKGGSRITLECNCTLIHQEEVPIQVQCVARDITTRKRAEESLRRSEQKFFTAFRAFPGAISISTLADGRILDANESFLRLSGFTREEVVGRTTIELGLWPAPVARNQIVAELRERGRISDREITIRTRHGSSRLILFSAELVELEGETCVIGSGRDITEQRLLEEQFRQAQKMEAVGRLAGGVAHDFNNLLGVILGYAEMLIEELGPDHPLAKKAHGIYRAGERAAALTRQLLAFSRQQMLQQTVLDLNAVVGEISKLVERLIGEDVRLVLDLDPNLGRVKADGGQLEQVIMNLAVNARDAMPNGGRLTLRTSAVELTEAPARQHRVVRGRYVQLEVVDTGIGMDEATQARIFEPFFTTKDRGKGTGLGLATAYGIVKQSGGYIWVHSRPGLGSTFRVLLPQVDAPLDHSEPPARAETPAGCETILLVEDEEALLDMMREFLRARGYCVLEARDGAEAYEIALEHDGDIHLVVTDVVMPRMSGRALAHQIKHLRPATRVLFVSGYPAEPFDARSFSDGAFFLRKPFRRDDLLQRVREALDATL
jgi:PAS domain S-box-containing protein